MTTIDFSATLLAGLYPGTVAAAATSEPAPATELLGPELEAAAGMAPKRRREFVQGRGCARSALQELGVRAGAIPKGEDRAPVWPAGLIGSISHTNGIAAAVAARRSELLGIGLDIEQRGKLEQDTARLILRADEARRFDAAEALLVFSIKEAIYKALYPTLQRYVDFQEMDVELLPEQQRFVATPHPDGWDAARVAGLTGRYQLTADYVISAAWLPASAG